LFKQAAAIGTIAVVLTILFILWPVAVQATDSTNAQVKLNGVLHFTFFMASERPACVAQVQGCSLARVEVPYITTLDGDNYQLLGVQPAYLDGTKLVVTGWLQAPSGSGGVLSPALTFAGAITVTSFYAHCEKHLG
jgi:hypothetical protein